MLTGCGSLEMTRSNNLQHAKKPDAWHFPVQPLVGQITGCIKHNKKKITSGTKSI